MYRSQVCITPLRMLLKKETDRRSFALINMLMDHEKEENGRVRDKQVFWKLFLSGGRGGGNSKIISCRGKWD
jgi:hypothetical protein